MSVVVGQECPTYCTVLPPNRGGLDDGGLDDLPRRLAWRGGNCLSPRRNLFRDSRFGLGSDGGGLGVRLALFGVELGLALLV
ncbi:MAG: hypothetical protein ACP5XB_16020, partial [Isosphaeraceae bacterium]